MKTLKTLILAFSLLFCSCAVPENSPFNPLDAPQAKVLTVEELHSQNISAITSNPTKNKTVEIE